MAAEAGRVYHINMHRLFCSIGIDKAGADLISAYCSGIAPFLREARPSWTDPANFHLTLYFFGEMEEAASLELRERIRGMDRRYGRVTLSKPEILMLPSARAPRVLSLGMRAQPREEIERLVRDLAGIAAELGAKVELRPWRAHLTLARLKTPRYSREFMDVALPDLGISPPGFELMESFLSPQGPTYQAVESAAFATW